MFVLLKKRHLFSMVCICSVLLLLITFMPYGKTQSVSVQEGLPLPIVMYHQITKSENRVGKYVVTDKQFEKDLQYLKSQGYESINMTQLINYVKKGEALPPKPVMITFDDGHESFYEYIIPLLEKYDMKAVMSVVGDYTDIYTKTPDHHLSYSYLTWSEIEELTKNEHAEIQNHTYYMHKNSSARRGCKNNKNESLQDYEIALNNDIGKLQKEIFQRTGWRPNTFTYPYGFMSEESEKILKAMGFEATLTCTEKLNIITHDEKCLFSLGRYNRANGKTSEQFFTCIK